MRVDLGAFVPALRGWTLCINETSCDCIICVRLPDWAGNLGEHEKVYLALYITSRHLLDYRLTASMHVYLVRNKVALRPEIFTKALKDAKVVSKIPRAIGEESPYAWEAVLYKGILYAEQILSLDKPIIVKVEPPKDKRARERLRVLLEGKRVTIKGRTYHVGGLTKKLGGQRMAPWTYLLPRRNVPKLIKQVNSRARVNVAG